MVENFESKRGVSKDWLKNNVYDAMETIEECERRIKIGCADLKEYMTYINLGLEHLNTIRLQNMRMMIAEFEIIIENTQDILGKEEYEICKEKIQEIRRMFERGIQYDSKDGEKIDNPVYEERRKGKKSNGEKQSIIILTRVFYFIGNSLFSLRSRMVKNLSHIFWVAADMKEKKQEI